MTAPRLLGMLCVRNEASRYLRACLQWHQFVLDDIFVYDDQSTDNSAAIARSAGAQVVVRPDGVPSFLQHEGNFRQAAWEAFELGLQPNEGDWVLAFDADEFLAYPRIINARSLLLDIAKMLQDDGNAGCKVKISEIFDIGEDGTHYVRTDGFWSDIAGVRFFEYRPGGQFANRAMGCGSAPWYVSPVVECLEILHFGYLKPEDRVEKYNRYLGLPGHNPRHIESIVTQPTLEPWHGLAPT